MKYLLPFLMVVYCIAGHARVNNIALEKPSYSSYSTHLKNIFNIGLNGSLNNNAEKLEACKKALKPLQDLYMTVDFSTDKNDEFAHVKDNGFGLSAMLNALNLMFATTHSYMITKDFPGKYGAYRPRQILFTVPKYAVPTIEVVFTSEKDQCVLSNSSKYGE